VASLVLVASCSSDPETERRTAAEHGRDLFGSTKTSNSALNVFSCATCHHADRAAELRERSQEEETWSAPEAVA
jgi:cytochrome c553